jgi:hypothetical protein
MTQLMWLRAGRSVLRRLLRELPAVSKPLLQRVACDTSSEHAAALKPPAAAAAADPDAAAKGDRFIAGILLTRTQGSSE